MDIPVAELLGIGICLLFSAFFSGSETALTSLSRISINQIIEAHPRAGRTLLHWRNNHTAILTTILVGNNITNITASALATELATEFFPGQGVPIAIGGMTFLLLFSGEITPKTFAKAYAERLALPLMNAVFVAHIVLFPVTWVLTGFIRLLFKVLGSTSEERPITEEDLEFIVSLSGREGAIDLDKQSLLSSIFEFSDTVSREIMVPRTDMKAIPLDSPYEKVVEVALESGFSRIPVYEDSIDRVVGVFYTKDLITPPQPEEKEGFLRNRMRPPVFVPESKKISELLKQFQKEHTHMAIVVNEFGGTEGIVTLEDVIEELLGEIQDEFDVEPDRLIELPNGKYVADARVDVEELEDALGVDFPEEREYESLGGFLMEVAGEVPGVGWAHRYGSYIFEVTEADVNRVIKVRIDPAPAQSGADEPATATEADEPAAATGTGRD